MGECSDGETRIAEGKVQYCLNGVWVDLEDSVRPLRRDPDPDTEIAP